MYLTASRPHIMYATGVCARCPSQPKESHFLVVKRIMGYLIGTSYMGPWYSKRLGFELKALEMHIMVVATWTRRAYLVTTSFLETNSYVGIQKSNSVCTTTFEAKYVAIAIFCSQVLWMQTQLSDYGLSTRRSQFIMI